VQHAHHQLSIIIATLHQQQQLVDEHSPQAANHGYA
jgi:hypothetical protein